MQQQGKDGGKNPLKLRLDLNLEVEVTLKARIHGDLTLALLYVLFRFFFHYLMILQICFSLQSPPFTPLQLLE